MSYLAHHTGLQERNITSTIGVVLQVIPSPQQHQWNLGDGVMMVMVTG